MRKIRTYRFHIGTKIPFSEWPQIVHRYLDSLGLKSSGFLYCFEDLNWFRGTEEERARQLAERRVSGPCSRALRDCPALGETRLRQEKDFSFLTLSNINTGAVFPEENILPLMKKLHRYYGFAECDLFYTGIPFFGEESPVARDPRVAEQACERRELPFDPNTNLANQPVGSMIHLHRDLLRTNYLELSIDLLHHGAEKDPAPYLEPMRALLPKIRIQEFTGIVPTPEERAAVLALKLPERAAQPKMRCSSFFNENLYAFCRKNEKAGPFSVPRAMKKLAKKRGFFYRPDPYESEYALARRVENRHWIQLSALVDKGNTISLSASGISVSLEFHTLGYRCRFSSTGFFPCGQEDLEAFLDHVLSLIEQSERGLLREFCTNFPPCPEWFEPLPFWMEPI